MDNQNYSSSNATHDTDTKTKLWLFSVLLATVLLLVLAFASGWLRFGLSGPFIYVLYIISGLLAAVTCYGLLSSIGELQGERYGIALRLGGAIVAMVVVAGGGGLYERYLQTPASFNQRVNFYSNNINQLEKIEGAATLSFGTERRTERLHTTGTVLFQGIPAQHLAKPLSIELDSPDYELEAIDQSVTLSDRQPVYLKVKQKRQFASPEEAKITVHYNEGTAINYVGRPDAQNVVFRLRVISISELAVPLDSNALLEVISNSGVPILAVPLNLPDGVIIPSRTAKTVTLEGFIPNDLFDIARTGKTGIITLYYDQSIRRTDVVFQTDFTFSEQTVSSGP